MSESKRKRCFIITPIGNETDPIRRHIDGIIEAAIIPSLGEKYEIIVAHKISAPGTITKQIINEIYTDELVIANLTDRNPNVMYELAFRHTIGKPVIMISEKGTSLPADIIMERTIFYQNDAKGVLELKEALIKAESVIELEAKRSPIIDILGDISHDTSVLENVNKNDKEPLEYILHRLTKIEDAVLMSNRKLNSRIEDGKNVIERRLMFEFDNMNSVDKEELDLQIIETAAEDGINIFRFRIVESDNKIFVNFTDNNARSYTNTKRYFYDLFKRFNINITNTLVL